MKALILAAGRGTRIRSVHGDRPKCLIPCNGSASTILDHQIESLFSVGIAKIGIVVGYEKDQIIQHVVTKYRDRHRRFCFIENPLFATTNNIYSFWLARMWLNGEPFVCLNGDVVFDTRILVPALESVAPITMIVDPEWRDETMKVIISEDRVIRMSKRILQSEFSGTYIGITSFAADVQEELFAKINNLIRTGHENDFFNVAVQQLADEGVRVSFTSTGHLPWAEIDDPGDLVFARLSVFPRLTSRSVAA
ncbi:MAG: phosphocholine cytidylyltransferase family protein [Acidobacteriaceae bacterium]|nr:phosphocholine cytidylyltransferase family protein [Acidobacteriaceae bacterium]